MTGGSQRAKEINQQLGIIAKETGRLRQDLSRQR